MLSSKNNIFAKESAAGSDNPAVMTMKMKGLLKGLRYISQIFDEEEEQELQIGNPTDVKHVAHIGWDGPTANAPSWINKFKGEGEGDPNNGAKGEEKRTQSGLDSTTESSTKRKSDKSKGSRRKGSAEASTLESPRKSETKTRQLLPIGDDSEPPSASANKEKSSRRKKSKASSNTSSRPSKSKHTSQSVEGLAYSAPNKGPSGSKSGGAGQGFKNKETSF